MSEKEKNNKDVIVKFRMTKEEAEWLEKKFQNSHAKNKSDFIRKMILDGLIINIDENTDKVLRQSICSVSNNVNQIAKRLNATGNFYEQDLEEIKEGVDRNWQLLNSLQLNVTNLKQSNILPIPKRPTTEISYGTTY